MRDLTLFVSLLVPLAMSACSGSSSDDPSETGVTDDDDDDDVVYTGCLADGIAVDAGTGIDAYEGITPGDEMIMVHGPQGGWHIDVGGIVANTEQVVSIDAVFTNTATGMVVAGDQVPVNQALVGWDETSCTGEFYGLRVFLDDITDNVTQDDICALEGAELEMEVTVTAISADPPPSTTDVMLVTAALDEIDVSVCAK